MKPKRPDSAKSHHTKQTFDSDQSKKDFTSSRLSETFSSGVNSLHRQKIEKQQSTFEKYMEEKNKDPKFQHLNKTKLEKIEEKPEPKIPLKKQQQVFEKNQKKPSVRKPLQQPQPVINNKPFQRKNNSKLIENSNPKIEQTTKKQTCEVSSEDVMSLSKGFAEKNKQKLNGLKNTSNGTVKQQEKTKIIRLDGFTFNDNSGIKYQSKKVVKLEKQKTVIQKTNQKEVKEEKVQKNISPKKEESNVQNKKRQIVSYGQAKTKKTAQQIERQQKMLQISQFINKMQAQNIQFYPIGYDDYIEKSQCSDIDKININDFLNEPTEQDFDKIKTKIRKLDQKINEEEKLSNEQVKMQKSMSSEIDLDDLIESSYEQESQVFLSEISSDQLKKRNLFLTEILKGKITKQQIQTIDEMDKSSMKMHKLEFKEDEEDDLEGTEINMMKRKGNRLMDRNRIEASGQVYRDCDYLSEEHQRRLEHLLNSELEASPFEIDQMESLRNRRIDQGIQMYREFSNSIQATQDFLHQAALPKDPLLRKQAEKKIIKEKIKNVNQRLLNLHNIVINKTKIQSLVKQYEGTKLSKMSESLLLQKKQQFEKQSEQLAEAEEIIKKSISEKKQLQKILKDVEDRFRELQIEVNQIRLMDEQQMKQKQLKQLKKKKAEINEISGMTSNIDKEIQQFQNSRKELMKKIQILEEIESMSSNEAIRYENYKENETIEDIDSMISRRFEVQKQNVPYNWRNEEE